MLLGERGDRPRVTSATQPRFHRSMRPLRRRHRSGRRGPGRSPTRGRAAAPHNRYDLHRVWKKLPHAAPECAPPGIRGRRSAGRYRRGQRNRPRWSQIGPQNTLTSGFPGPVALITFNVGNRTGRPARRSNRNPAGHVAHLCPGRRRVACGSGRGSRPGNATILRLLAPSRQRHGRLQSSTGVGLPAFTTIAATLMPLVLSSARK